jgi:AAA15 family ATPase/GTPase
LKNFKSWADTKPVHLAPLTGFFGVNSSGKTSLLQSLLMLKQTVESADRKRPLNTGDDHTLTDIGNILDIIYGHNKSRFIDIGLSWEPGKSNPITANDPEKKNEKLFKLTYFIFKPALAKKIAGLLPKNFLIHLRTIWLSEWRKRNKTID